LGFCWGKELKGAAVRFCEKGRPDVFKKNQNKAYGFSKNFPLWEFFKKKAPGGGGGGGGP